MELELQGGFFQLLGKTRVEQVRGRGNKGVSAASGAVGLCWHTSEGRTFHTDQPRVYWQQGAIPCPIPFLFIQSSDSSGGCGTRAAAEPRSPRRGCPRLSSFSCASLSPPGVADPRERAHPVPDRARGGARRPFQEGRHRGLASDGAECAPQRRYLGEQPPSSPCFPSTPAFPFLSPLSQLLTSL